MVKLIFMLNLRVADAYHRGEKVAFHCGTGKSRTETVAAGTLDSSATNLFIDQMKRCTIMIGCIFLGRYLWTRLFNHELEV